MYSFRICLGLLLGGVLGLVGESGAQVPAGKTKLHQQLYWTRYYNQLALSPKWELHTELDNRRFVRPHVQHQSVFRTHLHYLIGSGWDVGAGFVRFYQWPQDPLATNRLVVPEWRFFAEINQRSSLWQIQIRQRHRLEDRYFRRVENGALAAGYRTNYRFRYQLQADYPLLRKEGQRQGTLLLKVSDEIMFNFGQSIVRNSFDQNRVYVAFSYQLLENLATEVGYLHWFQQQPNGDVFVDRDIARLTVYHRMALPKKKAGS